MKQDKQVFIWIFGALCVLLMILPLVVTFNDLLTRIVEQNVLYSWVQQHIVPIEAKMMGAILIFFGYDYAFSPSNAIVVVNGVNMGLTWNCLGWQSFLLLMITLFVGLKSRYSRTSIFLAIGIGIMGIFWLNIIRMIFTVMLAVHLPPVFRIVFHDYLAAIVTIVGLIVFWWFSYKFVLIEKANKLTIPYRHDRMRRIRSRNEENTTRKRSYISYIQSRSE